MIQVRLKKFFFHLLQRISTRTSSLVPAPFMALWSCLAQYSSVGIIRPMITFSKLPPNSLLRSSMRSYKLCDQHLPLHFSLLNTYLKLVNDDICLISRWTWTKNGSAGWMVFTMRVYLWDDGKWWVSDYLGFLVAAFFDLQRERLEIIRLILSGLTMKMCLFLIAHRSESLHHITSYHHAKRNTAEKMGAYLCTNWCYLILTIILKIHIWGRNIYFKLLCCRKQKWSWRMTTSFN